MALAESRRSGALTAGVKARAHRPPWPLVRLVHPQGPSIHLLPVEAANRFCGLRLGRKLYEGEAPRSAGFPVGADMYVRDLTCCAEGFGELLLSGAKTQVANEDPS